MAHPVKDAVVDIGDDEAVIQVDVSDLELPEEEVKEGDGSEEVQLAPEPEPEPKKKPIPRVRLKEGELTDAAKTALETSLRTAEERARIAEASAQSERQQREVLTRRTEQLEVEAAATETRAEQTRLNLLTQSIESASRELNAYESDLQRSTEAGDFAKMAKLQVEISKTAARVDRLSADKEALENAPPKPRQQASDEGRVTPTVTDQREYYLTNVIQGYESRNWLRAHPECLPPEVGGDSTAHSKMMAGHYAAKAQKIAEASPEYFRVIEEHIGHRMKPEADIEDDTPEPVQKKPVQRRAQPAAPVSRDSPSPDGLPQGTRQVTLTAAEQEAAKISFPHLPVKEALSQYARNKIELQAEKMLGRTHV